MTETSKPALRPAHLVRSLVALLIGTLILRAAAGAMGESIQYYFAAIHAAATNASDPLRAMVGSQNIYPISYTLGGVIISTYFISELFGSLVLGAWSDRLGRKLFIIFGPLFGAIAVLLTSVTTLLGLLVLTRLLEGLSTGSNAPATLGYIAEATVDSPKLRTRISGLFEVATIGGLAIGLSMGGWLWRETGTAAYIWGIPFTSPAFAIDGIIYLVSFAILWLGIHEVVERKRTRAEKSSSVTKTLKGYWQILSDPLVASFAPAWIAINGVLGIWLNHTARILTDKSSFPSQLLVGQFNSLQAGNITAAYAIFFILGIVTWSVFFPQLKRTTAMLIGSAGLIASCLLISAINHQGSISAPFTIVLAVLLVISIMVQSSFTPAALAYLADITETRSSSRGAIMGLYSVFLGLGQFLGISIGGIFIDHAGADGMALITGLLGVFALLLVIRLRTTGLQPQPTHAG